MKKLATLSLLFVSFLGFAQSIPLDSWRSHFSYSSARLLTQANNTLFCATDNGLFSVDVNSHELNILDKTNGLSDVSITSIHFAESTSQLIIGYESGAIDLIHNDGTITNLTTFKDAPVVGNKRINDIESEGSSAYLATSIGVVKINLANKTVIENYRNIGSGGLPIIASEVTVKGDSLYIITENGIQTGNVNDNLLDFNDWTYFVETNTGVFNQLISADNNLYVLRDETELLKYNGNAWQTIGVTFPSSINDLQFEDKLYALSANEIFVVDPIPASVLTDPLLTYGNSFLRLNGAFWVADANSGLIHINQTAEVLIPAGPLNNQPSRIEAVDQNIYALFGPKPDQYNGTSDGLGYSVFTNGQWSNIEIPDFYNISDVAGSSSGLYFSSMGFGIYTESTNDILDQSNSILKEGNNFNGVQISGLDSYNNEVLALSYNAPDALYRINPDQSIEQFSTSQTGFSRATNFTISIGGLIWAIRSPSEGGGIGIFDPILNQTRTLRTSDGLPSSSVSSLAIDSEDEAWIGTNSGIANFSSASFPFNSFGASIPIFQNGFLFEDETINSVLTDGGDRIWVGTNEGVWVLSKDLSDVAHRFTKSNSPLPDDNIISFAYEGRSGEMFILTSKGLVSYRSASSKAEIVHSPRIEIFPNPVRLGKDSVVGIGGLARNANVRITDTSGRIVKELDAVGGTASWDLDTFNSTKVNPGIYLVFSSNTDGSDTMVGKIAVLR